MTFMHSIKVAAAAAAISVAALGLAAAQDIPAAPAAGVSAKVDAIRAAGALRVAVQTRGPWLLENTTGDGEPWNGPAWTLGKTVAEALGVQLALVPVSEETKVPVLAANQADITLSPLAETPERLKIIDFVLYSNNATCMFGRADNPKLAGLTTVDALDNPDITIAYATGSGNEAWVKTRFPKAQLKAVTATVEEVVAGHADVTPVNRVAWAPLQNATPGLVVFPAENNCQDSTELATPVGAAIDKGNPEFLEWLRAVAAAIQPKLTEEEAAITATMK